MRDRVPAVVLAIAIASLVAYWEAEAEEGSPAGAAAPAGEAAPAEEGPVPLDGAELYTQRTCIACHGPDAKTPILPEYPRLAGQSAPYLLAQMKDIKSGARNNGNTPAMAGVMHLVN